VERFWPSWSKKLFGYDDTATRYRGFTWPSFFFFSNRYIALFGHIPVILQYFWSTQSGDLDEIKASGPLRRIGSPNLMGGR
jgi:hypothetical protein